MNNNIKAVAVMEHYSENSNLPYMMQCIGAFENVSEAYGEALLTFNEFPSDDFTITPLGELEGETGFAMDLKDKDGYMRMRAYIFFVEQQEVEGYGNSK